MNGHTEYAFWLANRAANDRAIEAFQNGIDPAPPLLRDWIKYVLGHLAASLQAPRQQRSAVTGLEAAAHALVGSRGSVLSAALLNFSEEGTGRKKCL
jgi:hypothetical protein